MQRNVSPQSPISSHSSRLRRGRGGQSLVEFALVSPVLLFILFAIIQFSVLMITKSALTFATRQGARVASIHGAEPDANDQICAAIRAGLSNRGNNPDNLGAVTIYRAPTSELNAAGNDNAANVHDVGTCTGGHWTYQVVGWPYYSRNIVDPPDPIGVSLTYKFRFILPMFGGGLTLQDASVLRVEPQYAEGSSGITGPTPAPTYTPTPYPTSTPYPTATTYPTSTPYPTATPTPTSH